MAQAIGNVSIITLILFVLCILNHYKIASAAVYAVGDAQGWSFGIQSWPIGKQFHTGDILVFTYPNTRHSVVVVDENGFRTCNSTKGQEFTSGNDQIKLQKEQNYFICGKPGHCAGGMKMTISAA
ncbi:basic blue protein-like [Argentina anserina]|uniref:basic blue protein-like n=1 Tax=Argentina anserina TaxID=57926 RepID=UPI0021765BE7|nr:basic blue protein-like [Potentilla anserina]